ncbi:MAG: energy transducer TonB [Gemmatimonadota bacterium]
MTASEQSYDVAHTANDAFKREYANWQYGGVIAAVLLHFGLFVLVKPFQAADLGIVNDEIDVVELPPEVEIPPPPQQISRPATPKVASVELDEDITIAPTTFESNPVDNLPPPPETGSPSDRPSFIPYDTPPKLKNPSEIQRLLQRLYPASLKSAGVGGTVVLWVYVDKRGRVDKSVVKESSGHTALDEAAHRVADAMQFVPAMNRDKVTDVWVQQPITFSVK